MKVTAVVYTSNTGFTARYAELLGKRTGLPVYDLKGGSLPETGAKVLYLGWLMAGSVKGLEKARRKWDVQAVCAVGMGTPEMGQEKEVEKKYPGLPVFYLQGGYDHGRLRGVYKLMMGMMRRAMEKKPPEDPAAARMLDAVKNGACWVTEEQLEPVLAWLEGES